MSTLYITLFQQNITALIMMGWYMAVQKSRQDGSQWIS